MEEKWEKEVKGLPLEKQWHKLFKRNSAKRTEWRTIKQNIWSGSTCKQTVLLRKILPDIFEEYNIKSFVDCGCADFHWQKEVDWIGIDYFGMDIVPELIEKNKRNFPEFKFESRNLAKTEIPKGDLIFMRGVLVHLQISDCLKIIDNIKEGGSKYLMVSTNRVVDTNRETSCIVLQPRNLILPPFNFPEPIKYISDFSNKDEIMGLWKIEDL